MNKATITIEIEPAYIDQISRLSNAIAWMMEVADLTYTVDVEHSETDEPELTQALNLYDERRNWTDAGVSEKSSLYEEDSTDV